MIRKTATKLSLVAMIPLLGACDAFKDDSLGNICAAFPTFCEDFHEITDCQYNRTAVIRTRYYDQISPSGATKRDFLDELDKYHACLELTLFMQFTKDKQRKEKRLQNYLASEALIKQEVLAHKGTTDPVLAYYFWTRYQDTQAGEVFLAAATHAEVSDPRLIFKLAAINAKQDPQRSLDLFYRGLAMSNSLAEIPRTTFISIMNIFYQQKHFKQAYIWALIAKTEDEQDHYPINLTLILQKGVRGGNRLIANADQLEYKAERYYKQLRAGRFQTTAPSLR